MKPFLAATVTALAIASIAAATAPCDQPSSGPTSTSTGQPMGRRMHRPLKFVNAPADVNGTTPRPTGPSVPPARGQGDAGDTATHPPASKALANPPGP